MKQKLQRLTELLNKDKWTVEELNEKSKLATELAPFIANFSTLGTYRVVLSSVAGDTLVAYVRASSQEEAEAEVKKVPSDCCCDWVDSVTLMSNNNIVITSFEFKHEGAPCLPGNF